MSIKIERGDGGVFIHVWAQPGASRSTIVGAQGEYLKVAVTAKAVEGEANRALSDLLAKALGLRRNQVSIASGSRGRRKRLFLEGLSLEEAQERLKGLMAE